MSSFVDQLLARLQTRETKHGKVFVLDFRTAQFAVLGRKTEMLLDPNVIGQGQAGPTTHLDTAKRWVRQHYAKRIRDEVTANEAIAMRSQGPLTVAAACDEYLVQLESEEGHSKHTRRNRGAIIEAHVKPRLGSRLLQELDRKLVREFLGAVRVRKQDDSGRWVTQNASKGYQRDLRACLSAVWRANVPDVDPPFEGVIVRGPSSAAARRKAAFAGDLETLLSPASGAQQAPELQRTLVGAAWYDREQIVGKANTSRWAVPNTAEAIATQVATGMRIEELMLLRWKCIREDDGTIVVLGTKSHAAVRIIPLQDAFRPWVSRLKELARPAGADDSWTPDPMSFVFITNRKHPRRMGSTRAVSNRISKAQIAAGTKRAGKATHWARATYASILRGKIPPAEVKQYLGHEESFGGATDGYLDVTAANIPPEHRRLIDQLPSPPQIEAALRGFIPVNYAKPRASKRHKTGRVRKSAGAHR